MSDFELELAFWLKKRGLYPFITFKGGGMKAVVNIEIPLDEIAERFGVDMLEIGGKRWYKVGKKDANKTDSDL